MLAALIWYPFFKAADKAECKKEAEREAAKAAKKAADKAECEKEAEREAAKAAKKAAKAAVKA